MKISLTECVFISPISFAIDLFINIIFHPSNKDMGVDVSVVWMWAMNCVAL